MNEQTKLSPEDGARLSALQHRQELLERDAQILRLEMQVFQAHVMIHYGNPNESIEVCTDLSLKRKPQEPPAEAK